MTLDDIRTTVADFADAARKAIEAGFEGVEVHGANGYLLHQFLAKNTNLRTDEYGGPVAHRIRFVVEVVRAVAEAIGPERVGVRLSPGLTVNGISEGEPEETDAVYRALVPALAELGDLAYLHLVYADPDAGLFRRIRADWPGTLVANPILPAAQIPADGGFQAAERLLAAGADLISLGRPFLANPDLVARLRAAAPVNPVRDKGLMYVGGESGYTDYPTWDPASSRSARPRVSTPSATALVEPAA
jgi:N-ethylmaleimide reductase